MASIACRRICLLIWVGLPLLGLIHRANAANKKITLQEGGSIEVTCPKAPPGTILAASYGKTSTNNNYVTFFSRHNNEEPFEQQATDGDMVTLDQTRMVMTVSNINIRDNGAVFHCKVISTVKQVSNTFTVTITVAPKLNFTVSPAPPYKDRTAIVVTCILERVSPALKESGMSLGIAGQRFKDVTMTRNQDGSYRYAITKRHMVTKSEDNKETNCKAITVSGKQYKKMVRIQLVRPPSGKPSLVRSKTVLYTGETLKLTCNLVRKGIPNAHKYTWFKNGRAFKNTDKPTHTLKIVSESTAGSFSCKGTNTEGQSEVSSAKCVAFTKKHYEGSPIPIWVSVVSFLLNIAAIVFIVMVHIKPPVDKFLISRNLKILKKKKGKDQTQTDVDVVDGTLTEKPTEHKESDVEIPNVIVNSYHQDDTKDDVKDDTKNIEALVTPTPPHNTSEKHPEQLGEEFTDKLPPEDAPECTADVRM